MTSPSSPAAVWSPPARVRGTIALVVGRAERAPVYERFGRRLSADGYVVGVFEDASASAAAWLSEQPEGPRVLAGSDAGANAVLGAVAGGVRVDGVLLAGIVADGTAALPSDEQRTACPVHLGVLADPSSRASADGALPVLPDAAALAGVTTPVLAVHGSADAVTSFADATDALSPLPDLELVETVDGLHDALNDQSHRSVAASIVLWLERLRTGDHRTPIVRISDAGAAA